MPGQFVTLDLPIHEKSSKRWRSYSIASWPDRTNVFELIIVLDKKGAGTPYLFNEVEVGTRLSFRGPQGVFTLKEPLDKEIFMKLQSVASAGGKIRILSSTVISPSTLKAIEEFGKKYPNTKHVVYDAVSY